MPNTRKKKTRAELETELASLKELCEKQKKIIEDLIREELTKEGKIIST